MQRTPLHANDRGSVIRAIPTRRVARSVLFAPEDFSPLAAHRGGLFLSQRARPALPRPAASRPDKEKSPAN